MFRLAAGRASACELRLPLRPTALRPTALVFDLGAMAVREEGECGDRGDAAVALHELRRLALPRGLDKVRVALPPWFLTSQGLPLAPISIAQGIGLWPPLEVAPGKVGEPYTRNRLCANPKNLNPKPHNS